MSSLPPPPASTNIPKADLELSESETDEEEEHEEMKGITLSTIPPLRYFYKNKTLKQVAKNLQRFQHRGDLLDRVSLFQGDITRLEVDSIVNAANRSLLGGGGVDGAIHTAAGRGLLRECSSLGGASTGDAKITGGHNLPAKHVIHAVGPVYSSAQRDIKAAQLSACYSNSLKLALEHNLTSIAFCSISTGIYGYPIEAATHIALETTRKFLDEKEESKNMERVIFVVWSDKDKHVYEDLLPRYFPEESPETDAVDEASAEPAVAAESEAVAKSPKSSDEVTEAEKGESTKEATEPKEPAAPKPKE